MALVVVTAGSGVAAAESVDPAQWPAVPGADPSMETTAHSVRFSGPDRYQTNLALNLALRGKGDFPFDTPDRTSNGATGLAQADDWWGAGSCPRSILVVAGDTFADALAAASLSDPTDRASQPRVQRVAAADPLFDPTGGFDRVDTAFAPIVVTRSARSGATALAPTARTTASDLAQGGCTTAREAIIVGGSTAVPTAVESELVELGYREVFRVAGADRYETAARVATALGTAPPPVAGTPCLDPDVTDSSARMGWYGNAVAEFRLTATSCQLLPRAVVLADGDTGADALAAGWWTSHWQVPVLLTAGDGSLPAGTRTALQTLDIDSIIVLGGVARIPEATVDQAKALAGAVAGRIAGADRYATSVEMAKSFGGWHPTGDGADFEHDMVCLAASTGNGARSTGWPDALAAGPWCGRVGGAAAAVGGPTRALPPVNGPFALSNAAGGARPTHDAVPILLVPSGSLGLAPSTADLLAGAFAPGPWCDGEEGETCLSPGFGVVVGGPSVVSPAIAVEASDLVSGGTYDEREDLAPELEVGFVTDLDLAPVFTVGGPDAVDKVCWLRSEVKGVRWVTATPDAARLAQPDVFDLLEGGIYQADVDGVVRSSGVNAPFCAQFDGSSDTATIAGASVSGVLDRHGTIDLSIDRRLGLSAAVVQGANAQSAGPERTWSSSGFEAGAHLEIGRSSRPLVNATLDVRLTESTEDRGRFVGEVRAVVSGDAALVEVTGEALLLDGIWRLRGRATAQISGVNRYVGGFTAELPDDPEEVVQIRWRFDGVRK